MPAAELSFVEADDELWHEYDVLARRAYGHPVEDIMALSSYADRRVAVRGGRVVAGGLSILVPQWFGGRPVPSASLGCGCVAPEDRGDRLAGRLITERLRPMRDQGAVLATLWTASTSYVRRLGWEAPTQVHSWTVPTDELRRRFDDCDLEIEHGETTQLRSLRDELAAWWNGPWQRPSWWPDWQQRRHPGLSTYRFSPAGSEPTGVLSVVRESDPVAGLQLVVHDFWAADHLTTRSMLAFLGRHNSRIPAVAFQRTALPPAPLFLQLHRPAAATVRAWHPWMLRILDLRRAVELRGWPAEVSLDLPLEIASEDGTNSEQFTLRIADGSGDLAPGREPARLTLSRGQFAVWYAGGYRNAAAAALAGVDGDPAALACLLLATADREPWLADHF